MSISYKHTERLQRDAKAIKKFLEKTLKIPFQVSNAKVLNALALLFDWDDWNAMTSHVHNENEHVFWHNLRWHEKNRQFETRFTGFLSKLTAGYNELPKDQVEQLKLYVQSSFIADNSLPTPPLANDSLVSKLKLARIFDTSEKTTYSILSEHRQREGLEVVFSSMRVLTAHLERDFFGGSYRPGCVVFCSAFDVRTFEEMFLQVGYDVKFVGDSHEYRPTTEVTSSKNPYFTLEPLFDVPAEHPASIESYFEHLLNALPVTFRSPSRVGQTWHLAEIYAELFRRWMSGESFWGSPLKSLKELIDIAKFDPDSRIAQLIKKYAMFLGVSAVPWPDAQDIPLRAMEESQYVLMTIAAEVEIIGNIIRRKHRERNLLRTGVKPSDGEVWIHVTNGCVNIHHSITVYHMLLSQWAHRQDEDCVWVFTPNDRPFLKFTHRDDLFLFAEHNRARASSLLYGFDPIGIIDVSTRVHVNSNDFWFEDLTSRISNRRRR